MSKEKPIRRSSPNSSRNSGARTSLADRLGMPGAARAVAGACTANHIAPAVPCCRIVRSDGDLAAYRWGIERKRALISKEAAA